jgi:hypothetical protein
MKNRNRFFTAALILVATSRRLPAQRGNSSTVKAAIEGDVPRHRGGGYEARRRQDDPFATRCRWAAGYAGSALRPTQESTSTTRVVAREAAVRIAREERPGGRSIYDVLSREQRIDKGLVALDRERRDTAVAILARALVYSTSAGIGAHHRAVAPRRGNYVVFSAWKIMTKQYYWWAPLTVVSQSSIARDLDNSVITTTSAFCSQS